MKSTFGNRFGYGFPLDTKKFDPLKIRGLQLYLNKRNATPSSWLDQSNNAFDFVETTGIKQPVINTNSVDFDGIDDSQTVLGADLLNGTKGIIYFSGYFDNSNTNLYLTSADNTVSDKYIWFGLNSLGNVHFQVINGATSNQFKSTNAVTNGDYFNSAIESTSLGYNIYLNGVIEAKINVSGADDGKWFSFVTNRKDLTLGAVLRSVPFYKPCKENKVIYANVNHSDAEKKEIFDFMSNTNS